MITKLFSLCVRFLEELGRITGLSYEEISVIFNLHIQGLILMICGTLPLLCAIYHLATTSSINYSALVITGLLFVVHALGYTWMLVHYHGPTNLVFEKCKNELQQLAVSWHTTYFAVNIYIFVIGWLVVLGIDIYTLYKVAS